MKITHRVPNLRRPHGDTVSDAYQAEVDRHTAKLEAEYRAAQKNLAAAVRRLDRVRAESVSRATAKAHDRRLREATALAEMRREQLEQLQAMMTRVPASSQHRSREAHRPVPITRGTLL